MSKQDIRELFQRTLSGDYEDAAAWEAVSALRRLGTREIFDIASEWCRSDDPLKRARGASVIGQLGKTVDHPFNSFPKESYSVIVELLEHETEPRPLASAIAALGHLDNLDAVPVIAPFHSHSDADVRFDLAFALGCFPEDPLSMQTLLRLMEDNDKDVRDWATFGIGVLGNADSPEIREALLRNLADSDQDVAEEAIVGLAKRKDMRVLPRLLEVLEHWTVTPRGIEAACFILGIDERKEWKPSDYAASVRQFADGLQRNC